MSIDFPGAPEEEVPAALSALGLARFYGDGRLAIDLLPQTEADHRAYADADAAEVLFRGPVFIRIRTAHDGQQKGRVVLVVECVPRTREADALLLRAADHCRESFMPRTEEADDA